MSFVLVLSSLSVRNRKKTKTNFILRGREIIIFVLIISRFSGCGVEEDAWEAPPPYTSVLTTCSSQGQSLDQELTCRCSEVSSEDEGGEEWS